MKFIDEAEIYVKAGDGGRGCISFRREKFVPRGGPNGGDGGKGGDIIISTSRSCSTLLDLRYRKHHVAKHGGHGEGSNRTGRNSPDVEIVVPVGTIVKDAKTGEVLADLAVDGERFIVAKGGIGGRGNARFATPTNRAPRYAQSGIEGEERQLKLELKLLADVGIIGFPNAGKSTFIAKVSAAKPKIAEYPFTTLAPNLGVVSYGDYQSFVIGDIPGLIAGAHAGMGMGTKFLRHIERCALLFHIIDISGETHSSAWQDFEVINQELALFSPALMKKSQIVAISKIDLFLARERIKGEIASFAEKGIKLLPFSALTGEGIADIINEIAEKLHQTRTC